MCVAEVAIVTDSSLSRTVEVQQLQSAAFEQLRKGSSIPDV
jgi:hypothetical protein